MTVHPTAGFAAVILAGGRAQRLGGADKPGLAVGGAPMLHRVLSAVGDADPRVVVGPPRDGLPPGVVRTVERPPGGGPVAAIAAGLAAVAAPDPAGLVAVLAADLPFLTPDAVGLLRLQLTAREADGPGAYDGAVFVDEAGRRQLLCAVWRRSSLERALSALGDPAGRSMRHLIAALRVAETLWRVSDRAPLPPWFDCDTEADLRLAQEWTG
ncbi:MAG TPA: NTP transferase domain-containing protein [Micromonosporaceae bacterium]|nr:NTP transferase domain-containing protein [Micromonosporaceae bacterium]